MREYGQWSDSNGNGGFVFTELTKEELQAAINMQDKYPFKQVVFDETSGELTVALEMPNVWEGTGIRATIMFAAKNPKLAAITGEYSENPVANTPIPLALLTVIHPT